MDACLFAASFWLAYVLRSNLDIVDLFNLPPVNPFEDYVWLYLIVIPAGAIILEAQGFYTRPMLCSRRTTAWQLAKACLITVLSLILIAFFFKMVLARSVIVWFGFISFALVMIKEELLRAAFKSDLARAQYLKRFIFVGTREETSRMKRGNRRSHDALGAPAYVEDKDSGELRRPHHIDLKSGKYRGRQVLVVKEEA